MKWLISVLVAIAAAGGGVYGWLQVMNHYGGASFVEVIPEKASIKVDEQLPLEINAKDGQNIYIRDAKISNWFSENPELASVSLGGIITGLIPGPTKIKGDFRGCKVTVPVVVFSEDNMVSDLAPEEPVIGQFDSSSKDNMVSVPPILKQNTIELIRLPLDGALIYIFTQKENHRSCAEKLKGLIDKTNATLFVSSNMEGPDLSDIRYYSDKPAVKKSVEMIRNQLEKHGINAIPKRKKKGILGWFQISSELIEVWFGKNDTCKI